LVTGASSGIGAGFADLLGRQQVDLVLVARDVAALDAVAARARLHGVQAEVLAADLATDEGIERVAAAITSADPPIDLVINNAGLGQWGWFADLPLDRAIETLRVNNDAVVGISHAAVRAMLRSGGGTIIQLSSMASAAPGPQQAVYAASKAFVSSFGQALSAELDGSPITCTTVLPGFTRTQYFARAGLEVNLPANRWMAPEHLALLALDAAQHGQRLLIPGARNRIKIAISTPFPSLAYGRAKSGTRRALEAARRIPRRGADRPSHKVAVPAPT
jgi:short-subunit dehydrogenase